MDAGAKQRKMAVVYDRQALQYCLEHPFFDSICLPLDFWSPEQMETEAGNICRRGKHVFLSLPQIVRERDRDRCTKIICQSPCWSGIYVHTVGQAQMAYEMEGRTAPLYASASFYQWNRWALAAAAALFSIRGAQLPVELSAKECESLLAGWETLKVEAPEGSARERMTMSGCVYGRIPLMRSAQCIKKTRGVCDHRQETVFLETQDKKRLPAVSHCDYCYTTIWTEQPRNLIGQENGTWMGKLDTVCFHFFLDEEKTIGKIIRDYMQWEKNGFGTVGDRKPDGYWKYGIE